MEFADFEAQFRSGVSAYASPAEREHRAFVFAETLAHIESHNLRHDAGEVGFRWAPKK